MTPVTASGTTGLAGATTDVGVSITAVIRSAETAARGTIIDIIVAIITAIRIWMR